MIKAYKVNVELFVEVDSENDLISENFINDEINKTIKNNKYFIVGVIKPNQISRSFSCNNRPETAKEIPVLKLKDFPDVQRQLYRQYKQYQEMIYDLNKPKKSLLGKLSHFFGIPTYYR